ncbi:hypothetical protein AKO1_013722 [Acrasis kona]|uniref:RWP-RK domain-containing protein n=1 Tax=Acrasis kona TaxID=1008807 RepID=A0AAW2ZKK4_9EUKA
MTQNEACKELNISLSTLKRRYYELNLGKWPVNKYHSRKKEKTNKENKCNLSYILNKQDNTNTVQQNSNIHWIDEALKNFNKNSTVSLVVDENLRTQV